MHEYDVTLKTVLEALSGPALRLVTGTDVVVHWPGTQPLQVRSPRVDLLGETADQRLIHIELQSTNDPNMAVRMLEYAVGIKRAYGRFPVQVLLYAGRPLMKMQNRLDEPDLTFRYRLVDMRQLDSEPLLASSHLEDNVIAILTRLVDQRGAVRRILARIAASKPASRELAMAELTTLAGLRGLGDILKGEVTGMPILDDIMDHDLFGPKIREGMAAGRAAGLEEGRKEGERQVVRRLMEKRFGPMTPWAEDRLKSLTVEEIEHVALRLLEAATLQELLG